MNRRNYNRALTNGRRHSFHRTRPHIAYGEDAGDRCLEWPTLFGASGSPDESTCIQLDAVSQPLRTRHGSDHYEKVLDGQASIALIRVPCNVAQVLIALQEHYL